jgi:hypothetical protein
MVGYTFTPQNRTVSVSGANVIGQDFTGTSTIQFGYRGQAGANVTGQNFTGRPF